MEEAREGEREHWGFGDLGGRTYSVRQQHVPPPPSPGLDHPDPAAHPADGDGSEEENSSSGEGEGEFQGPVNILAYGSAILARLQQQGKRGRRVTASSEAAILRLLPEVTPAACCAICLEDFADAAAAADPLPLRAMPSCSHTFHRHCILKWLRLKDVCPVCRCQLPLSLSEEEEGDEEEEEQARRSSSRRRANVDAWLALVAQHTSQRQRQD